MDSNRRKPQPSPSKLNSRPRRLPPGRPHTRGRIGLSEERLWASIDLLTRSTWRFSGDFRRSKTSPLTERFGQAVKTGTLLSPSMERPRWYVVYFQTACGRPGWRPAKRRPRAYRAVLPRRRQKPDTKTQSLRLWYLGAFRRIRTDKRRYRLESTWLISRQTVRSRTQGWRSMPIVFACWQLISDAIMHCCRADIEGEDIACWTSIFGCTESECRFYPGQSAFLVL